MQKIIDLIGMDCFYLIIISLISLLLIAFFIVVVQLNQLNKKYKKFLAKLGNGKNIEQDLETYMSSVKKVENQNDQIIQFCNHLNENLTSCIQKVGIVRYNAFQDTGSDLSFALALLDDRNNGVVFNGIYSREMSNIYAKPIQNGESTYPISEEEKQAICKAIQSKEIYSIE